VLCKHRPASEALTSIVKGLLPTRRSIDKVRTRRAFVGATQPTIPSSGPVSCTSIVCSLKKREQRRPKRGLASHYFHHRHRTARPARCRLLTPLWKGGANMAKH